ncbi:T9SS C-terminal target domain-containing protein [bacterium]|nr:MAG: T9SS C-terminal target domain-containing protein [bacterium]
MVNHYDKVAMLTIPDIHNPDPHVAVPRKYGLQTGPNPFNSSLTVSYMLPQTDMVRVEIYNMYGQLVTEFNEGLKTADKKHEIDWNGKDLYGQNVSSGVLLIKLITSEGSETKKAILLR